MEWRDAGGDELHAPTGKDLDSRIELAQNRTMVDRVQALKEPVQGMVTHDRDRTLEQVEFASVDRRSHHRQAVPLRPTSQYMQLRQACLTLPSAGRATRPESSSRTGWCARPIGIARDRPPRASRWSADPRAAAASPRVHAFRHESSRHGRASVLLTLSGTLESGSHRSSLNHVRACITPVDQGRAAFIAIVVSSQRTGEYGVLP